MWCMRGNVGPYGCRMRGGRYDTETTLAFGLAPALAGTTAFIVVTAAAVSSQAGPAGSRRTARPPRRMSRS
jgi:hypothetical protein